MLQNDTNIKLNKLIKSDSSVDVNLQDQTTKPIVAYFSLVENETTLNVDSAIDDRTITVTDPTGFTAGKYISLFSVPDNRFMLAVVVSVLGSVVTLDTPLDFAFPTGTFATVGIRNMNQNGSVTPVIFGLRNTEEAIGATFDITRIMFSCLTATACDYSLFGDLTALAKGLVLRKKDGIYQNIFNAKTNGELANLMYDFEILQATNPVQGQDGFKGRLTFAGQNKMGVAIRLAPGEDLQLIIQDDLTGLTRLEIIAEGHEVE